MEVITSPAKWILCGEHSVVRGGKALAFPLRDYSNSFTVEKSGVFSIDADREFSKETIFSLLETASEFLNVPLSEVSSRIVVRSDIPTKAGLGSSAALCSNVARLFNRYGFCDDMLTLAKNLENRFHQKSSGLDVAVALENKPVIFQNNRVIEFLESNFWPPMILTYSGEKSITSDCAKVVREVFSKDEKLAVKLDRQMNIASELCEDALKTANFYKLREGITLGNDVFQRWGLCDSLMSFHIKKLLSDGAVAAKPIGSGLGGYILSLWEEKPQKYEDICLTLKKP
jgi:mevalonate kinase